MWCHSHPWVCRSTPRTLLLTGLFDILWGYNTSPELCLELSRTGGGEEVAYSPWAALSACNPFCRGQSLRLLDISRGSQGDLYSSGWKRTENKTLRCSYSIPNRWRLSGSRFSPAARLKSCTSRLSTLLKMSFLFFEGLRSFSILVNVSHFWKVAQALGNNIHSRVVPSHLLTGKCMKTVCLLHWFTEIPGEPWEGWKVRFYFVHVQISKIE